MVAARSHIFSGRVVSDVAVVAPAAGVRKPDSAIAGALAIAGASGPLCEAIGFLAAASSGRLTEAETDSRVFWPVRASSTSARISASWVRNSSIEADSASGAEPTGAAVPP